MVQEALFLLSNITVTGLVGTKTDALAHIGLQSVGLEDVARDGEQRPVGDPSRPQTLRLVLQEDAEEEHCEADGDEDRADEPQVHQVALCRPRLRHNKASFARVVNFLGGVRCRAGYEELEAWD